MEQHQWVRSTELRSMKRHFEPQEILYADGSGELHKLAFDLSRICLSDRLELSSVARSSSKTYGYRELNDEIDEANAMIAATPCPVGPHSPLPMAYCASEVARSA